MSLRTLGSKFFFRVRFYLSPRVKLERKGGLLYLDLLRVMQRVWNPPRVECNLCGWRGLAFYPDVNDPGGVMWEARCPRCSAPPRLRGLWLYLQSESLLGPGARLLDIGPSPIYRRLLEDIGVSYVSLDIEPSVAMVRGGIISLPFREQSFDYVLCYHVLEHVIEDVQGMAEIYRVLKKDGLAFVASPFRGEKTIEYGSPRPDEHGHVRYYGGDIVGRLESVGFRVQVESHQPAAAERDRYRLYTTPYVFFLARRPV